MNLFTHSKSQTASFEINGSVFCFGEAFTVTNTSTGSPTSYLWEINGSTIEVIGATTPNPTFLPSDSGTITLTLNNGSTYSQDFAVIKEIRTLAGPDISICEGQTVQLLSEVIIFPDNQDVNYSWSPNIYLDDANIATATATPLQPVDTNIIIYTLTVSAGNCVPSTNNVLIEINESPSGIFTVTPSSGIPPLDVIFEFSPDNTNTSHVVVIFDNNGNFISNESIVNWTFTEEGTYTFTAQLGSNSCVSQNTATVIVSNTLSTNTNDLNDFVTIHPNPLSSKSILKIEKINYSIDIDLIDYSGKVIRKYYNQTQNNIPIERGKLNSGLYCLIIKENQTNKILGQLKLVVQ